MPVIGCGSGPGCDGQILIAPDILGLTQGPSPEFAKRQDDLASDTIKALNRFSAEAKSNEFPDAEHSYHMRSGEFEKLQKLLKDKL